MIISTITLLFIFVFFILLGQHLYPANYSQMNYSHQQLQRANEGHNGGQGQGQGQGQQMHQNINGNNNGNNNQQQTSYSQQQQQSNNFNNQSNGIGK